MWDLGFYCSSGRVRYGCKDIGAVGIMCVFSGVSGLFG